MGKAHSFAHILLSDNAAQNGIDRETSGSAEEHKYKNCKVHHCQLLYDKRVACMYYEKSYAHGENHWDEA